MCVKAPDDVSVLVRQVAEARSSVWIEDRLLQQIRPDTPIQGHCLPEMLLGLTGDADHVERGRHANKSCG
jgi:hypothetical protein